MKINPIIQKFESQFIKIKSKKKFVNTVRSGDIVSFIYYDLEKEQTRVQQFTGVCKSLISANLNTKLTVYNIIAKVKVEQQFFLYSKIVVDVMIVRRVRGSLIK